MVRAAAFRRSALSLQKAISIGLKSGRIGREKEQAGSGLFDRLTDAGYPVGGKIVHDDEVARPKLGRQHLLGISQEGGSVHRPVEQHRRCQSVQPKPGGEGGRLPMPVGNRRAAAFAFPRPAHPTSPSSSMRTSRR